MTDEPAMPPTKQDLMEFLFAVEEAFPHDAPRDKFGRYSGTRHTERLRLLAVKLGCAGGAFDTQDQAGMIARKMIGSDK